LKKSDEIHFKRFIDFVFDPDAGCMEFVAWKACVSRSNLIEKAENYARTIGGWYNRVDSLKFDIGRLNGASGYCSINPIRNDLLARSENAVMTIRKGLGTKEEHILCYRFFLIDIDSERLEGISATDEELSYAIELRDRILSDHPEIRQASLWGCSGNGAYILTRIPDLEIKQGKNTVKSVLKSLASQYGKKGKDKAFVDTNTHSPVFHVGVPGTYKCKGTSTEERPHRLITVDNPIDSRLDANS